MTYEKEITIICDQDNCPARITIPQTRDEEEEAMFFAETNGWTNPSDNIHYCKNCPREDDYDPLHNRAVVGADEK